MQHDTRGGGEPWSHARRPSPVESGNRGNAELGACGVRGCTGVGVKKVARDVRFDVMAGRTRCLNVTRYNRARHTKGSFCSFPPRHTKRRRRSAGEGGRVARETHRGRPVRSPTALLATLSPLPARSEKEPVGCIAGSRRGQGGLKCTKTDIINLYSTHKPARCLKR